MIKVKFKKDDHGIKKIELLGHALFASAGKDIVCASATTIAIVTSNAIERLYGQDAITSSATDGSITLQIKKTNDTIQILLENMIDSLQELENQYPKYINILK